MSEYDTDNNDHVYHYITSVCIYCNTPKHVVEDYGITYCVRDNTVSPKVLYLSEYYMELLDKHSTKEQKNV